jgi:single-strand DNA-binding protein
MASYNKIILMGNLTRDPQMSYLPSNTAVVEIGLAVNHKYKDQAGNQQEKVCFVDCRAFGRRAEVLNQYMRKGNPLLVEGRLELDQWQDKEGKNRSKHRVFIETFSFVGAPQGGGGGAGAGGGGGGYAPQQQQQQQVPQQAPMGQAPIPPAPMPAAGSAPQQSAPQPNAYDEPMPGGEEIPF